MTGPIYDDHRQDVIGNLTREQVRNLPDWARDIALSIHDNTIKTEFLAPHIDVGTTQENIQDIINNTVGINLRDQGFDYTTALNSPNIATKDSVLAAATLAKSGDIDLSESLPEMISQVDTFKAVTDATKTVPARVSKAAQNKEKARMRELAKQQAADKHKANVAAAKAKHEENLRVAELTRQATSRAQAARSGAAAEAQAARGRVAAAREVQRFMASRAYQEEGATLSAAMKDALAAGQVDTFADIGGWAGRSPGAAIDSSDRGTGPF